MIHLARFSDDFIQQIRDRNDIESVIGSYIDLKRRGKNLVGLCPFHNEKTPSFTVYPETASYYCFGCGAGGEVINFVRNIESNHIAFNIKASVHSSLFDKNNNSKSDNCKSIAGSNSYVYTDSGACIISYGAMGKYQNTSTRYYKVVTFFDIDFHFFQF